MIGLVIYVRRDPIRFWLTYILISHVHLKFRMVVYFCFSTFSKSPVICRKVSWNWSDFGRVFSIVNHEENFYRETPFGFSKKSTVKVGGDLLLMSNWIRIGNESNSIIFLKTYSLEQMKGRWSERHVLCWRSKDRGVWGRLSSRGDSGSYGDRGFWYRSERKLYKGINWIY